MNQTNTHDAFEELKAIVKTNDSAMSEYIADQMRIAISMSLKKLRRLKQKTQKEIGDALEVKENWVSAIESCNTNHAIEAVTKYLFALNTDITINATLEDGTTLELASSKKDINWK